MSESRDHICPRCGSYLPTVTVQVPVYEDCHYRRARPGRAESSRSLRGARRSRRVRPLHGVVLMKHEFSLASKLATAMMSVMSSTWTTMIRLPKVD